jgi:hypothetical protein
MSKSDFSKVSQVKNKPQKLDEEFHFLLKKQSMDDHLSTFLIKPQAPETQVENFQIYPN